jgi:outer membrane protein W
VLSCSRFGLAISLLIFCSALQAQERPESKNQFTFGLGYSWPQDGSLKESFSLGGERSFSTANAPVFMLAYTRAIRGPWAWRLDLSYSSYNSTRTNYHSAFGRSDPHHHIPLTALNGSICYRFSPSAFFSPYIGVGLNAMAASGDSEKTFLVHAWGASYMSPTSRLHFGPSFLAGCSWRIDNSISLTLEAQYCYNGWVAEKWVWHGYHVGDFDKVGYETIFVNPLNIVVGLSLRW